MLSAIESDLGKLLALEVYVADVTLRDPLGFAGGTHQAGRRAFLRLVTAASEGWGEFAALEVPVGADPSMDSLLHALESLWLGRLGEAAASRGGACPGSEAIGLLGSTSPVDRACAAGIEMAVLDAELRAAETSLASWLQVASAEVPFGGLVGIPKDESLDSVVAEAEALLALGAGRLRVKIRPGFAVAPLGALRGRFAEVLLQADANGSFTLDQAEELRRLDEFSLTCIEEPLIGRDFAATAQLAARISTPLCLDESIGTTRAAADAFRYGAASVLCLKPGRLGGLRPTLAIQELALAKEAQWFMGGMFETGLGRAYLGALAARAGGGLVSDVVAPCEYLDEDPCGLPGPTNGLQGLWSAPGVGPWPSTGVTLVTDWVC